MKVLQLCHKPPFPAKDGGCIAMNNVTHGLMAAGHEVKILTIFTHKHDLELENLGQEYLDATQIEGVYVDTRINMVDAFSTLLTADSYNISRFFSTDFDIKLSKLLKKQKFDVIHLESLFMTPYIATIRRFSKARIVLRSHNLEYVIWERIARGTRNVAKRTYLKYLSKQLKTYELDVMNRVDGIAAISTEEYSKYQKLGLKKPVTTLPFGVNVENYTLAEDPPEMALFHLGSMDWVPNLEGMIWFLEEVWPAVLETNPNVKLYLAGRSFPEHLQQSQYPNVEVLGEVSSARAFIRSKAIMVVPLLSAGGIRVKIIEGMALGKAIISTKVGAEGIDCKHGKNIHLANNKAEFVTAISELINSPEKVHEMGIEARKLVEDHFDNRKITSKLVEFYQSLILP
jgi:polysaccharide biosynthesis protein PslH